MNSTVILVRVLFLTFCAIFSTLYFTNQVTAEMNFTSLTIGIVGGLLAGSLIILVEMLTKKMGLKNFNLIALGMLCGYFAGEVVLIVAKGIFSLANAAFFPEQLPLIYALLFAFTCYVGVMLALRAGNELQFVIPFVKFEAQGKAKKNILIDFSTLLDTRIIELASTGLLDNHLLIPQFLIKELNLMNEHGDEAAKAKSRRCFEVLRKLESIEGLNIQYIDTDFPDIKDIHAKLSYLARMLDATLMTADLKRPQHTAADGIRTVNIHDLSKAFRAIPQSGEFLSIKIQRRGKEPGQGVGYLEDGTMVVVNGGEEFIFDTIKAQILSVKSTSSGRMVFCNAVDEALGLPNDIEDELEQHDEAHKNYFAIKSE